MSGGELVAMELVSKLIRTAVTDASRSGHGLVLDGYPRDLDQMQQFQNEVSCAHNKCYFNTNNIAKNVKIICSYLIKVLNKLFL